MVKKEKHLSQFLRVLFISLVLIAISSDFAFAATVVLNQPPNGVDAYISDSDYPQSLADNFLVSSAVKITQIRIWGMYSITHTPSATDNFTVIFHADSAGLPGAAISTQNNVPVTRQATGGTVYGSYAEYVYTLNLATPVNLGPGTYWVEIYNDTTADTNYFGWETGTLDPKNGIPNLAFADQVPGSSWHVSTSEDLAIEITQEPVAISIPTTNGWGMIIFVVLAGLGAVYHIRRQRRAEN